MMSASPVNALSSDKVIYINYSDINITDSDIERILALNPQDNESARASGLILTYNIGIEKNNNILTMAAKIICVSDVVICGFKKVVFQRRA